MFGKDKDKLGKAKAKAAEPEVDPVDGKGTVPQHKDNGGGDGHKPLGRQSEYRPMTAKGKFEAEDYLFGDDDDTLISRTDLGLVEINMVASEIMHEEATNPARDRIKMPLTKVKRLARFKAKLSYNRQSRDEAVGLSQAKAEEEAAKAAFD